MRVYGYVKLETDAYFNGTNVGLMLYNNKTDALDMAYISYKKEADSFIDTCLIDEDDVLNEETFKNNLECGVSVTVGFSNGKLQYDYIEKEVYGGDE